MLAYLVTNLATGSKYIGITKFSLRERWSGHRSSARPGGPSTPIARALRKYGEAAFRIEVIACMFQKVGTTSHVGVMVPLVVLFLKRLGRSIPRQVNDRQRTRIHERLCHV
jgi:hypothetical protein